MEDIGRNSDNPIWMALIPQKPKPRDMAVMMVLSIAPIAIAILMQKPALRQAIIMRTMHTTKEVCQEMADFWQIMATKAAQGYQKAQL